MGHVTPGQLGDWGNGRVTVGQENKRGGGGGHSSAPLDSYGKNVMNMSKSIKEEHFLSFSCTLQ